MKNIEEVIGYKFTDKSLLRQAFTHSSYVNEHGGDANERLEFLGDCILDFLVGEKLFHEYPTADEGELSEKTRGASFAQSACAHSRFFALDELSAYRRGRRQKEFFG